MFRKARDPLGRVPFFFWGCRACGRALCARADAIVCGRVVCVAWAVAEQCYFPVAARV